MSDNLTIDKLVPCIIYLRAGVSCERSEMVIKLGEPLQPIFNGLLGRSFL